MLSSSNAKSFANINSNHTHLLLLTASLEILVVSLVSTITTIVVLLYALYLLYSRRQESVGSEVNFSLISNNWNHEQFHSFFARFLLKDEIRILDSLATALITDEPNILLHSLDENIGFDGWRNKHQLSQDSEVSQNVLYRKDGILERLVSLSLVIMKDSDKGWGGQKYQYQYNYTDSLLLSYLRVLKNGKHNRTS